ncbi:MAG TPA: class I SAM-dependent methyltransferase, partial [Gammaproteobacteria bacterium]|nr:class I SAM-dependent methyltransferase [Gammaproteobacteria bacterium]
MSAPSEASRRVVCDACPLCGATSWDAFVDGGPQGLEWVRCACGAVFKHREPASVQMAEPASVEKAEPASVEKAEPASVEMAEPASVGTAERASAGQPEPASSHYDEAYFTRYERRRRRRIAKSRRQILDALDVAPPGRLLDVGCSLGYTLEAARTLGLDAAGVDLSAHAVAECLRRGFDARRGGLDDLPFNDASFALAILKHVFEHTPSPRRTLTELRRVLVPGGAIFLAVPNLEYFKASRSPETSRFFRGEGGEAHYVYYTPGTLSRLLEEEGFAVRSVHARLVHRRA